MIKHECSYDIKNLTCLVCAQQLNKTGETYRLMKENPGKNEGFDPDAFAKLFTLEEENFWFYCRNKIILWALKNFFPSALSFFEVGCGSGYVLSGIQKEKPQLKTYASDFHLEALGFVQQRLNDTTVFQMDARQIPFQNQFELIGAFDVIEHIDQDELVLSEIYKALIPGGGLMLTVPQHGFLWSKRDEISQHKRRYSCQELVRKVEAAGFRVVYKTSFVTFLLPLMFLSRSTQKKVASIDVYDELKLNPLLNKWLATIQLIELFFIRIGCRFPFGGSLLLVAKTPSS